MKDELTFYSIDTKSLEEKILSRDLLFGREITGHLERLGQHLGTLYFDKVSIGDIFRQLDKQTDAPFKFLLGMGKRRLDPAGPVTYCARHIPSELGEFAFHIGEIQKLKTLSTLTETQQNSLDEWLAFEKKAGLDKYDPGCLEALKKYLNKFKQRTPELISVYTRW